MILAGYLPTKSRNAGLGLTIAVRSILVKFSKIGSLNKGAIVDNFLAR
jgi:hypothetical protein